MRKIVIAYHAYLFGDHYMTMMTEQFRLLLSTGLFQEASKLYIGAVSVPNKKPTWGDEWLNNFWKFSSSKETPTLASKVEVVVYSKNDELRDTLRWIKDHSVNNPNDYILFFHTKGITSYTDATESWRRYMEYFVIENWKDCIEKLDEGYDCCGILWNHDTVYGDFPHFSGAFYWAKTSYINTLKHGMINSEGRYGQEFWIGSNPNCKVYEFHNSRMNDIRAFQESRSHYSLPYDRSNYERK